MFLGGKVGLEGGNSVVMQAIIVYIEDGAMAEVAFELDHCDVISMYIENGVCIGGDVGIN